MPRRIGKGVRERAWRPQHQHIHLKHRPVQQTVIPQVAPCQCSGFSVQLDPRAQQARYTRRQAQQPRAGA